MALGEQGKKGQATKPRDPKLVGGIYFNPPPLSVINKEHETGGVNQFNNFFTKKPAAKTEDNMDE